MARPARLSNRLALVSALQLLLVSGSFSLLSYSLGRRSGLERSEAVRQSASVVELSSRLASKLSYPIWINQLNLQWLRNQPGRVRDVAGLSERFWNQMQVFPVDYINLGNADGSFVGMERTDTGALQLNEDTSRSGRGSMAVYAMGPNGQREALLERIPGMTTSHEEAWYTDTAKAGRPTWSAIYSWEDQPEVFSISYNAPLFGADRQLQGVVGVDMVISQLSRWLEGVWKERQGLAVIVEPNGQLVASSIADLTLRRQGEQVQRARLEQLSHPLMQALNRAFFTANGQGQRQVSASSLRSGAAPQRVVLADQTYTLQSSRWGEEEGLQWILLTALAADPSGTSAERNSLLGLLAAAAALGGTVLLVNRQIRGLLTPLRQLEGASRQLSAALASAGASNTADLHFSSGVQAEDGAELTALDQAIADLVERYNTLTSNLRDAQERERFRDAQSLALLKEKLRSSLQAAAVAHEINQPLSALLLSSQLLLERSRRASDGPPLPAAWQEQLHTIRSEADRVVLTIEKMRALLRNVQTEHQPLDLREIARSALLYARSAGPAQRISIDGSQLERSSSALDQPLEPAWIQGDAVQVQIAIVNLLRNAAESLQEATQEAGSEQPWIGVRLARHGEQWWLEVADNGPGLADGLLSSAPLQTSKARGSGLGLFVVRTTMENHHGSVESGRSERGGALLRLRFPAYTAADATNLSDLPSTGD